MEATAVIAWRKLTEAVARAAGMDKPTHAADECIEIARQTCVRRTHRETIALAGRMRKGSSGTGGLASHVHVLLETIPSAAIVLTNLTTGKHEVRLRSAVELAQGAFDFHDKNVVLPGEDALTQILGTGFECAPLSRAADPYYLARDIEELVGDLIHGVAGERPAEADSGLNTYNEIADDIRRTAVQWLQRQVRKRLA